MNIAINEKWTYEVIVAAWTDHQPDMTDYALHGIAALSSIGAEIKKRIQPQTVAFEEGWEHGEHIWYARLTANSIHHAAKLWASLKNQFQKAINAELMIIHAGVFDRNGVQQRKIHIMETDSEGIDIQEYRGLPFRQCKSEGFKPGDIVAIGDFTAAEKERNNWATAIVTMVTDHPRHDKFVLVYMTDIRGISE